MTLSTGGDLCGETPGRLILLGNLEQLREQACHSGTLEELFLTLTTTESKIQATEG